MKSSSLNLVSGYSFFHSIVRIDEYCKKAKEYSYQAVGINDDNIYSYPEFEKECRRNDLKPIFLKSISIDLHLYREIKASFVILNETGYKNMLKINNRKEAFSIDDLSSFNDGLGLILQIDSDFSFQDFQDMISPFLVKLKHLFSSHLFFGVSNKSREDKEELDIIYQFFDDNEYKVIPFPEIRYLNKSDNYLYQLFSSSVSEADEEIELKKEGPDFLLKENIFSLLYRKKDIDNLNSLADEIDFSLLKKRGDIIRFENEDKLLLNLSLNGLKRKIKDADERYLTRMDYELKIISKMGFSSYFLLVADYVKFAKDNGIKVGYGRGSAVGSLISFLCDITDIDPIIFSLSFERFLNPMRMTMPDIDIDFEDERRDEIFSYLERKYTQGKVAKIITFNRLRPRSSIALLGKVLKIPEEKIKRISSSISKDSKTFEDALNNKYYGEKLKKVILDPLYKKLFQYANKIISLPVSTSFHASGILVSSSLLSSSIPCLSGAYSLAQFEATYLEEMGFLKFDILSLSNLSFLKNIENKIHDIDFNEEDIKNNLNDKETYDTLNRIQVADIFQLDEDKTGGMKRAIRDIHIDCFDDLASLLAIYRPGSMSYISLYALRKKGKEKIEYSHPLLKPILEKTYGIMIYQEQVMEVLKTIASFSLAEADIFRRAISKKKIKEMEKYKEKFISQAEENGIDEKISLSIYSDIEKFASYGFNKSHAYAYAYLCYLFLYLKTHYKDQFYQTSLEKNRLNSDKGISLFLEMKERYKDIKIDLRFSLINDFYVDDDVLYLPLSYISSCEKEALEEIKKSCDKCSDYLSLFISISPFIYSGDQEEKRKNDVNKTLSSLIDAGALDYLSLNRKTMKDNLFRLLDSGRFIDLLKKQKIYPSKEDMGERFSLERDALGVLISTSLIKERDQRYLIVTDTIEYENRSNLIVTDGIREYNFYVENIKDVEKYSFLFVKGNFDKNTLYPERYKFIGREVRDEKNSDS